MESVLGVGGVFLRARDQAALAGWYRDNLGMDVSDVWHGAVLAARHADDRDTASTTWSSFAPDTEYFGRADQQVMINYRVRDLGAMIAQLRANGCDVDDKVEESEYGAFGWVTDCEGNRIELWQPPEKMPSMG